jgi:type I restriction enzyme M protein
MTDEDFTKQTKQLIDSLKTICANYGLGNDGNEFKIITQAFLYKFLNDKFGYEAKRIKPELAEASKWEAEAAKLPKGEYGLLLARLPASSARLRPEHFLSYLFSHQNDDDFANLFDDTLRAIALENNDIFAVQTSGGAKVALFDNNLSNYITDVSARNDFCRALINQLVNFSFENIFQQKFDFFSTIFEYLIKDYNKDGGGKYAEYYTPHAVARVMAEILVDEAVSNVKCYDPAAGSGTLLMSLAHTIGEDNCSIYSQDISQKSSGLLRLNLILNNLVHSIQNTVQGNTLVKPAHYTGTNLTKFDYIVSNPPFKLDFSDDQPILASSSYARRFFAGVPNIPKAKKDGMAIYLLFIQHIISSLTVKGKAAVVVPTGFLAAHSGIEMKIREHLVDNRMLRGAVSMPSNIFATTGTNVSILFIDKANTNGSIVLVDASMLGEQIKEGKNTKTLLSSNEEEKIIQTFKQHEATESFSVITSYEKIKEKGYSLSAGQYFDIKIEYTDITPSEFRDRISKFKNEIEAFSAESLDLSASIKNNLEQLIYAQDD